MGSIIVQNAFLDETTGRIPNKTWLDIRAVNEIGENKVENMFKKNKKLRWKKNECVCEQVTADYQHMLLPTFQSNNCLKPNILMKIARVLNQNLK